ncbi:hypothetical protein COU20_03000 [Candidatus Kaiserbacteria bacterium CG10_big_fil_rev_8_21_14_0_10_59_10]|uniref:Type II secretion system protein GspI C-terminal domain-containing protein n=1 Tax=Candidatus Kaiserbacteria bacterium CG10_big_fil_rev_8_21_14_0_10_59_10 TaxID=1974612 RepID=A0A2H0U7C1_9BACT|nr:MAG: hypothetical protein COU20_03000 [Candidatus Kaiserbacteria bacterium CG10_big_fil_rev_8_21_14_0_10_59_10]
MDSSRKRLATRHRASLRAVRGGFIPTPIGQCPDRHRGFTLIEILLTVFVLGASLALYTSAAMLTQALRSAKEQDIALRIAATKLEELRALSYDALPESGTFEADALAALREGTGEITVSEYNQKTKQVTVTVSWNHSKGARSVPLSTLITEVGGL